MSHTEETSKEGASRVLIALTKRARLSQNVVWRRVSQVRPAGGVSPCCRRCEVREVIGATR